jgi:uncharacterized protein (DUF305 family)
MKTHPISSAVLLVIALTAPLAAQEAPPRSGAMGFQHHIQDDADFVSRMLMHHHHGIEMSKAEIDRGQNEEVKQLARKIMEGQERDSRELESFQAKLGEQSGKVAMAAKDKPGMPRSRDAEAMSNMKQVMQAQMEKFRAASGPELDKMFVTMMSRHHQQGIEMARAAMPKLKTPEIREFAERTMETQKKEVAALKAVQK